MSTASFQFPTQTHCYFQYLNNQVQLLTENGVYEFSGKDYRLVNSSYPYPGGNAFDSQIDYDGFKYYSQKSIVQFGLNGVEEFASLDYPVLPDVRSFCVDQKNRLWLNTQMNGVYLLKPDQTKGPELVFSCDHLTNYVYEDKEGSIWITTMGYGIIQITPANQEIEILLPDLYETEKFPVTSVFTTPDGQIWCGGKKGTIYRFEENGSQQYQIGQNTEIIIDLTLFKERIYAAGILNTYCVDPRTGKSKNLQYINSDGTVSDRINFRRFSQNHNHLIAASYGIYEVHGEMDQPTVTTLAKAEAKSIDAVYMSELNDVFLASSAILGHFDGVRTTIDETLQDSLRTKITKILRLDENTLVYATNGSGVWLVQQGRLVEHITEQDGLCSNYCRDMSIVGDTIFVISSHGLTLFYRNENQWKFQSLHAPEELPTADLRKISVTSSHIFIASDVGLLRIKRDLPVLVPNPIPVTTHIQGVFVDDHLIESLVKPDIKADFTRMRFSFSGLSFLNPHLILLEYRTSMDTTWNPTTFHFVDFTSFQSGDQWFEVRARYFNGSWGPAARYEFKIIPEWYNHRFTRILMILVSIALIWFVARIIHLRNQRKLTIALERREAINQERNRIARDMHDDLGADLSNLLLVTRIGLQQAKESGNDFTAFSRLEQLTKESVQKIDNIIWALSSGKDNLEELVNYLEKYFMLFKSNLSLEGNFNATGHFKEYPMPAHIRRSLYLVVKEVLNNSAKHAQCTRIDLDISLHQHTLEIIIQDNGIGMNLGEESNGRNGIKNVAIRMEQIGGKFQIISQNGSGTKSTITLLLEK